MLCALVAQLDRALPSEGKGREFDSRQAHQQKTPAEKQREFLLTNRQILLTHLGGDFGSKIFLLLFDTFTQSKTGKIRQFDS